jgi:predicted HicB family RNase H-like nuclease
MDSAQNAGESKSHKLTLNMSTKKIPRRTKQVRISEKLHRMIRPLARDEAITLSKFVDLMIKSYIERNY